MFCISQSITIRRFTQAPEGLFDDLQQPLAANFLQRFAARLNHHRATCDSVAQAIDQRFPIVLAIEDCDNVALRIVEHHLLVEAVAHQSALARPPMPYSYPVCFPPRCFGMASCSVTRANPVQDRPKRNPAPLMRCSMFPKTCPRPARICSPSEFLQTTSATRPRACSTHCSWATSKATHDVSSATTPCLYCCPADYFYWPYNSLGWPYLQEINRLSCCRLPR